MAMYGNIETLLRMLDNMYKLEWWLKKTVYGVERVAGWKGLQQNCSDVDCSSVFVPSQVFKVRSREDGRLYAVKRSRQRFRGEWDRYVS